MLPNENGRSMRLLIVAVVVGALLLTSVCAVGGFFVYRAATTTKDTRPCKEQIDDFTDKLYSAVTLQSSAANEASEGNYSSALINAKLAEEMVTEIVPPDCSDAAVDVHTYELRAITLLRKSIEASMDGRFEDSIALQKESQAAIEMATISLKRLLSEY